MKSKGFTLVELMFVVAIIGILAAVALPAYNQYIARARVAESFVLLEPLQKAVAEYYQRWGEFPPTHEHAGLGKLELYGGKYTTIDLVSDGAIELTFDDGNRDPIKLFFRAAVVDAAGPANSLIWLCMQNEAPEGLRLLGGYQGPENNYSSQSLLPVECRA